MRTGLLWYDDDPERELAEKIKRVVQRYEQKYGTPANVCYVHPSALGGNGKVQKVDRVRVMSWPSVLRYHFWVGREEG